MARRTRSPALYGHRPAGRRADTSMPSALQGWARRHPRLTAALAALLLAPLALGALGTWLADLPAEGVVAALVLGLAWAIYRGLKRALD